MTRFTSHIFISDYVNWVYELEKNAVPADCLMFFVVLTVLILQKELCFHHVIMGSSF